MSMLLAVLLALTPVGTPEFLFKILPQSDWQACQSLDRLALGPDDQAFIHLAEAHQVEAIARKFFPAGKPLVIVKLNPGLLRGQLVLEANPGGTTRYYHLYDGYIPSEAVVSQATFTP